MIHRRRQHPEAVDTSASSFSSPPRMPQPQQPSTPQKLYPPSPRPGSPSYPSPQSTAAALYANGAPLLSPTPSYANGYYDSDDDSPASRAARLFRDAASSARAGFRDATRLERSVGLVWGWVLVSYHAVSLTLARDAELGSRVLKVAYVASWCACCLRAR